jgi:Fe2+ transport system protein B
MPAKEIALANLGMLFNNDLNTFFTTHIAMSMSYLVIFTIYIPCSATIATMVKEGS